MTREKGSISIGGQKLCDMSLEALNSRISYVAQDQYLFNTSLLENIRLGRLNATDEEVMEAAKKAQCMEFLKKLPQGIHSMAGDAGKMLSGGQRQRISLARAILKDAPIVVLDEATAYADPREWRKNGGCYCGAGEGKNLGSYRSQTSRYNERRSNMRYGSRKDGGNRKTSGADSSLPRIPKVVESGSGQRRVESIYCKGGKINVCIDFKNPEPLREV